jgi:hypothetical protein
MDLTTWYCPECHEDRPFDRPHETGCCPETGDDAGADPSAECPELACTECGLALVITFAPPVAAWHDYRRERVA